MRMGVYTRLRRSAGLATYDYDSVDSRIESLEQEHTGNIAVDQAV